MSTKEKILHTAGAIFAEKGYRGATVSRICRQAGVNIAAVNYHFGSKARLYEQVWEYASRRTDEIHGIDDPRLSPEHRLRNEIRKMITMIFDKGPGGWLPRLIRRISEVGEERAEELRTRFLLPRRRKMEEMVGEYLGEDPGSFRVRCLTGHIFSMCIFLNIKLRIRRDLFKKEEPTPDEIESLIGSIQEFALGGLERLKNPSI